jgi:hypothetical protein
VLVVVLDLVLDGVDCSDWLRSWLERFHLDSSVFSLLGRLIFENEDDDEHEDEKSSQNSKIPNYCSTEISKKKPGHPDTIEEPEEPRAMSRNSSLRSLWSLCSRILLCGLLFKSRPGHGKGSG